MSDKNLQGRKALVTGGNSGIGEAIARRLAAAGAHVVIHYRSHPQAVQKIVEEINKLGGQALAIEADISSEQDINNLFIAADHQVGAIDILINNAAPGAIITPINNAWLDDPKKRDEVLAKIPWGRIGRADEVAAAAWFLASDDAEYITGTTLFIDGGMSLYANFLSQG